MLPLGSYVLGPEFSQYPQDFNYLRISVAAGKTLTYVHLTETRAQNLTSVWVREDLQIRNKSGEIVRCVFFPFHDNTLIHEIK